MKLSPDRLKEVILQDVKHDYYLETVKIADHCAFHIEGYEYDWYGEATKNQFLGLKNINFLNYNGNIWFDILIGENRPEESTDSQAYTYRKKTYKPITKSTVNQVLNELQKITRSSDWQVKFTDDAPMGVDSLKDYFKSYPRWGDFTTFVQMVLVKMICSDPNALMVVAPVYGETEDDSLLPEPVVSFYHSRCVLDYSEDNYAICYDKKKDVYCIFTKESYREVKKKTNEDRTMSLVATLSVDYAKPLKVLNVKKLKGIYMKSDEGMVLYDSFISPMLPYLDKAARESSDLDASTVRAMFPQAWQWAGLNCTTCNGVGKVARMGQQTTCSSCGGLGSIAHSPSQVITIKADRLAGDQQLPIPPKGFIEPSVAIIELQRTSIRDHKFDALASLNFHFLDRTPLNESGKAKEVDQESLHNSIQKMAENLVENAKWIARATLEMRYSAWMSSTGVSVDALEKMLPEIPVPEDFSIITAEAYLGELEKAKMSGVSISTKKEIEREFIRKRWRNDEREKKRCMAYIDLNPAYGIEIGQIGLIEMDVLDKVIAINIISFVDKAIDEEKYFLDMERSEQLELMASYAEEKMPTPADDGLDDPDEDEVGSDAGESGGGRRLTPEEIIEIRNMEKRDIPRTQIAKKFRISTSYVSKIVRG